MTTTTLGDTHTAGPVLQARAGQMTGKQEGVRGRSYLGGSASLRGREAQGMPTYSTFFWVVIDKHYRRKTYMNKHREPLGYLEKPSRRRMKKKWAKKRGKP